MWRKEKTRKIEQTNHLIILVLQLIHKYIHVHLCVLHVLIPYTCTLYFTLVGWDGTFIKYQWRTDSGRIAGSGLWSCLYRNRSVYVYCGFKIINSWHVHLVSPFHVHWSLCYNGHHWYMCTCQSVLRIEVSFIQKLICTENSHLEESLLRSSIMRFYMYVHVHVFFTFSLSDPLLSSPQVFPILK